MLAGRAKCLAEKDGGQRGNCIIKFPGGFLIPGRPSEKRRTRGGRTSPALHWVSPPADPFQRCEPGCGNWEKSDGDHVQRRSRDAGGKIRLLIVSDSAERLRELRATLGFCEVEITAAASVEELRRLGDFARFDLAVVDVSPRAIPSVLNLLRDVKGGEETTILVESWHLAGQPELAGVLPRFRAMPCSRAELLRLVCGRIAPDSPRPDFQRELL